MDYWTAIRRLSEEVYWMVVIVAEDMFVLFVDLTRKDD